ncbi:MAG: B12-binding domain-containing radical SAM protein [Candidatus Scalindua sp.]|nr:B12-binding domain-containing radical SAM protein [Candidatus Scalindua sp.]
MSVRCIVDNTVSHSEKKVASTLRDNDRIIMEESHTVLDRSRNRADKRVGNRIALIQPRKGGRPALGLLYIGAYLLDNQYEVRIFEFLDELYPPNVRYNRGIWRDLKNYDPDFVGFGVISSTFRITQRLISKVREEMPRKIIICGGKHATSNPNDLLFSGADFCTIGESEITIVELLDALNFQESLDAVKGIAYLRDRKITSTPQRSFLPMDYILRPAFELVDYEKYVDFRLQSIPGHYLRAGFIFGSRGCPYRCEFCTTNIRSSYRERSVDDLIDEIEWQINKFNIEGFVVLDDLFYFRESRTVEFCKKIIERNVKTKFFCHARVDKVKKETVELMKNAGVLLLAVGVESGSQKILDSMKKGITVEQIENAFEIYNEAGINTFAFIIVGHPEETDEDRKMTRALLTKIKATNVAVNYYMPMPGTPSFEFEISSAKFLVDRKGFKGFTYTTDYPEFSTTIPLDALKMVGDEFESLSVVDRNKNLFSYPGFILFLLKYILFHPLIFLEGFYLRYLAHKTHQMSPMAVIKDAIQFHMQKF